MLTENAARAMGDAMGRAVVDELERRGWLNHDTINNLIDLGRGEGDGAGCQEDRNARTAAGGGS